ncbi:type VII secretion protein EssB [Metabacillus malikii]|uniref:Type VII secretion protein EssB n=1 Tax=Metabacillus malikii TaxID=1504265 RepID=A0ABT9ZEZ1_9BACI|nr:type VII secretion protein EssB [Metabacillus malikii]MDQ0230844.1 type VII secretion protein EssB [Metabacillus malikii]
MSSQKEMSYIEEKLEAIIKVEKQTIEFIFQKEKIKLNHQDEISFLKEINPVIKKQIQMMDDELSVRHTIPTSFTYLPHMQKIDERDRLLIAFRIVQSVISHTLTRIHLFVCPENIVVDKGLNPYFLHYGVKESLPPYEKNSDQLMQDVKATIASIVDIQYTFTQYVNYFETLKRTGLIDQICHANSLAELLTILDKRIQEINEERALLVTVNKKTWKLNRYILIGLAACFIPTLIFALYSLFFIQPKQASFIEAQEKFLKNEYSEVVTELQPYEFKEMPKVTQYELSIAYLINESLTEEQKEIIQNTVTLQSDPKYFEYWIHIGRGNADEALDIARLLEDRELILYGLFKYEEQVKADDNLDSDERKQLLTEIEAEIDQYRAEMEKEMEEEIVNEEAEVIEEDETSLPASGQSSELEQQGNAENEAIETKAEEKQTIQDSEEKK